jgi:hypothetical protein
MADPRREYLHGTVDMGRWVQLLYIVPSFFGIASSSLFPPPASKSCGCALLKQAMGSQQRHPLLHLRPLTTHRALAAHHLPVPARHLPIRRPIQRWRSQQPSCAHTTTDHRLGGGCAATIQGHVRRLQRARVEYQGLGYGGDEDGGQFRGLKAADPGRYGMGGANAG